MKPLSLNLSKIKKIASDKHASTFLHPDGHKIVVAHAPLSTLHRKQIEKMPIHKYADGSQDGPVAPDDSSAPPSNPDIDISDVDDGDSAPPATNMTAPTPAVGDINNINAQDAYASGIKAIGEKAAAEGNLGNAQADIEANRQIQLQDEQDNWDKKSADMQQDISDSIQNIQKGKIDPSRYLENRSTSQKIIQGIGLFLGGIGQARTGVNPGMDVINNRINQDIDAQKNGLNNNINVYNAYLSKYKNAQVADQMARATSLGAYASQLRQAGDQAMSPMAKANAHMAASQLEQSMIPAVQNAHLMGAISDFNSPSAPGAGSEAKYQTIMGGAQRMNPEYYKDMQSKYLPGIGVSSKPLDKDGFDGISALTELDPLIDKAITDQKGFGLTGSWSPSERATSSSDQAALNVSLNKLTGLKRLNGEEYKNYAQQIGSVGSPNLGGSLKALENLKQQAQSDRQAYYKTFGVKPFAGVAVPATTQAGVPNKPGSIIPLTDGRKVQIINAQGDYKFVK